MANKAQNLLNSIRDNCSSSAYETVQGIFDGAEKATPKKQGKMIQSCLKMLNENPEHMKPIMRQCNCLSASVISQAKKCYESASQNIPEFLTLLNEKHIGGGQLYIDENGDIIGIYDKCYCGIPKSTPNMPPYYCECSAGWFEKLFQSVFESHVEVQLIHTILGGFPECMFKIHYTPVMRQQSRPAPSMTG